MRLPRLLETIREKSSDEIVVFEAEPHEAHAAVWLDAPSGRVHSSEAGEIHDPAPFTRR